MMKLSDMDGPLPPGSSRPPTKDLGDGTKGQHEVSDRRLEDLTRLQKNTGGGGGRMC